MPDYFGDDADATAITKGDCERFLRWFKRQPKKCEPGEHAVNTIHKYIKTCRQAFDAAVKDNPVSLNPKAGLHTPEQVTDDRDFETDQPMAERICRPTVAQIRTVPSPAGERTQNGATRSPPVMSYVGLRFLHLRQRPMVAASSSLN